MTNALIIIEAIIMGFAIGVSVIVVAAFMFGVGSELDWDEMFEDIMNHIIDLGAECGKRIKGFGKN